MSEPTNGGAATPPKKRGTGYPQLSLRDSVEAIISLGQHGPSHTHDAAAAYLGHSTANSGAFRNKLAALRDWGLIARGDKDHVILSDLAQNLVLDGPDHDSAGPLLLTAFESCRVFGMLYNDSAKDLPQDLSRFRTNIVMRYGVASDQADKFLDSFVESVTYAQLGSFDGAKLTLFERDKAFRSTVSSSASESDGSSPAKAPPSQPNPPDPRSPLDTTFREAFAAPSASETPPVALRQTWPIDGGEIEFVIRTPKAMPPDIYSLMADMAGVAAKMEQLLRPASPTSPVAGE